MYRDDPLDYRLLYGNAVTEIERLRAALLPYAEKIIDSEDGGKTAREALK